MRKRKIVTLAVLAVLPLAFLAATFAFFRDARQGRVQYRLLEEAIGRGDWTRARLVLEQVLAWDENAERAIRCAVKIASAEGNAEEEVAWLEKLVRLNEFDAASVRAYLKALLRLRDFSRYEAALTFVTPSVRTDDDDAWLVYAAHFTRPADEARGIWKNWRNGRGSGSSDIVRLVDAIFEQDERPAGELETRLRTFADSSDAAVRLEALLALSDMCVSARRFAEAERHLDAAAELNADAALPKLVRLQLMCNRLDRAVELNGRYLRRHPSYRRGIEQAELLAAARRFDLLDGIRSLFPGGDYRSLVFKNYLDALESFDHGDGSALRTAVETYRGHVRTPWSYLMAAVSDAASSDPNRFAALEADWRGIQALPPFFDCRDRVRQIVRTALAEELAKGCDPQPFASLVEALLLRRADEPEDVELLRLNLLLGLRTGRLDARELEAALLRHPHDGTLQCLAAEADLAAGRVAEALARAERLREQSPDSAEVASLILRATFARSTREPSDEALRAAALTAMKAYFDGIGTPGDGDLSACWAYASTVRSPEALALLRTHADDYAPFCTSLLRDIGGDVEAAVRLLEESETRRPDLLLWSARRLAAADRLDAALRRYEALPEELRDDPLVKANMSEVLAQMGTRPRALKLASEAWERSPNHPVFQTCYARRLVEAGDWSRVLSVVRLPAHPSAADRPLLDAWTAAAEHLIPLKWDAGENHAVRDLCNRLLNVDPANARARDYRGRFDEWERTQLRSRQTAPDAQRKEPS